MSNTTPKKTLSPRERARCDHSERRPTADSRSWCPRCAEEALQAHSFDWSRIK